MLLLALLLSDINSSYIQFSDINSYNQFKDSAIKNLIGVVREGFLNHSVKVYSKIKIVTGNFLRIHRVIKRFVGTDMKKKFPRWAPKMILRFVKRRWFYTTRSNWKSLPSVPTLQLDINTIA